MRITTIDIEASGLGRGSYPIEIGVAMADGSGRCMLIRPHPDWQHWDPQAEALHGISRSVIARYGTAIDEAARRLNQWLAGETVYSDAWGNDSSWLALLFEYAGLSQHFKLQSLRHLLSEAQVAAWHPTRAAVEAELAFSRHRASNDARVLQQTYCRTLQSLDQPELSR